MSKRLHSSCLNPSSCSTYVLGSRWNLAFINRLFIVACYSLLQPTSEWKCKVFFWNLFTQVNIIGRTGVFHFQSSLNFTSPARMHGCDNHYSITITITITIYIYIYIQKRYNERYQYVTRLSVDPVYTGLHSGEWNQLSSPIWVFCRDQLCLWTSVIPSSACK